MFYLKNLCSSEIFTGIKPWEFTKFDLVPTECLQDKAARDKWINDTTTDFYVYSLTEGVAANIRLRKGADPNPPHSMWGFAADVDTNITFEQIEEFTKGMRYRPNWFEQTLSGNARLLWLFASKLMVPSRSFELAIRAELCEKLNLDILPGFDKPAFLTPERYYTNGCRWQKMASAPISDDSVRSTVMAVSEKFDWTSKELGKPTSLADVADECRRKYPKFVEWKGDFKLGATGPSFWITESESPKSAVIRETGMHTFSAHAAKAFYSWEEIVGKEFVEVTEEKKQGKAVENLFFDGKMYWFKDRKGQFVPSDSKRVELRLRGSFGITARKVKGQELSEVEQIFNYVNENQSVAAAGPCAFFPKGLITYNGKMILNTHSIDALTPAPDATPWGKDGKFPFVSGLLDQFYTTQEQLEIFLAWYKRFYLMCLNRKPVSGQALLAYGPTGTGKTLLGARLLGDSVGGAADGNQLFTEAGGFNGDLFKYGIITVNDAVTSTTDSGLLLLAEKLKAFVANPEHQFNEKYMVAHKLPWQGRIWFTGNTDANSLRRAPSLDMSNEDKMILLQVAKRTINFYEQEIMEELFKSELPHFLRWLHDWKAPSHCYNGADHRFGVRAYCNPELRAAMQKSSPLNSLGELLSKFLDSVFTDQDDKLEWSGTATDLRLEMSTNPQFSELLRSYRPEQMTRLLLQLASTKSIPMEVVDCLDTQHRIYKFPRRVRRNSSGQSSILTVNSQFQKP